MNKLIPTLIALSIISSPALANDFYQQTLQRNANIAAQQDRVAANMAQQQRNVNYNYQQPTCTYHGYQPNNSPDIINQPITRAQYPIAGDQQLQSPWVYNP
jgi:hypothetical protein